jgi:hypothetical protein
MEFWHQYLLPNSIIARFIPFYRHQKPKCGISPIATRFFIHSQASEIESEGGQLRSESQTERVWDENCRSYKTNSIIGVIIYFPALNRQVGWTTPFNKLSHEGAAFFCAPEGFLHNAVCIYVRVHLWSKIKK